MEAESELQETAKRTGLDVVKICPTVVLGPVLPSKANKIESLENKLPMIIDVRDVAEALLLAYQEPETDGRYICTAQMVKACDLVDKLKSTYPNDTYPKKGGNAEFREIAETGWVYRPLEETLIDSIKSYKKAGILN